ncbi:MAG: polysaccharide deacetylase family protein [Solirubrobacteraceae bacterium]
MRPSPLLNRSGDAAFLCYHSVHPDGPPFLSLPPETFERQLALLRRRGFHTAGLGVLDALTRGGRPRARHVFLTFDDGFLDNYTHAFPLMREYRATGLIFLLAPAVDDGAPLVWPEIEERRDHHPAVFRSMDWAMVETMAEHGIEFGSHTLAHHSLPSLGEEALRQELLDSRRRIVERLGRCDSLAYPFGHWDARVAAAAVDAGYRWAFTMPTGAQRKATAVSIPRIAIDERDDERRFALKLMPASRRVLLSPAKDRLRAGRTVVRRVVRGVRHAR